MVTAAITTTTTMATAKKLLLSALLCVFVASQAETIETARGVVELPADIDRIAVFNLGTLDTLNALGVGVDGAPSERFIDGLNAIPATAIGTVITADVEAVHHLQPDVIIIGERSAKQYDAVAPIATTLDLSLGKYGGKNIYQNAIKRLHQLAKLFHKETQAQRIEKRLNQQRDVARCAAVDAGKGMMVMLSGRNISLLGDNSLIAWITEELRLQTIGDSRYDSTAITDIQPISFEYIAIQKPQWLIVVDRNAAIGKLSQLSAAELFDNALVAQTPAAKNGRVIYLNSADALVSIGGVQAMQRTLTELVKAFSR